jgi:hypothetical protein
MRRTVAVVLSCIVAVPVAAQTPLAQQLLNKVPSLFGSAVAPRLMLPATPDVLGLTRSADRTVAGDPATFDVGGFRLGMSEEAVVANARAHGLKDGGTTRVSNFASQVRSLISVRGGAGGAETGKGVLGEVTLRDDAGGSYALHLLAWPDGAHLSAITYLAPQGTSAADWRQTLTAKWGRPARVTPGADLDARWGGGAGQAGATALLGPRGGTVTLAAPDGMSARAAQLVEQTADAFFAARAKRPSI